MQGFHGGSFHKRVAQLPFNAAVSWRSQHWSVVLPFGASSILARSRRAGGRLLSSAAGAPPLWFWLHDRKIRHRRSYSSFEQLTLHIPPSPPAEHWSASRTPWPFQIIGRVLPAKSMATVSAAPDEGGSRQLRRRKESHLSVSATEVVGSVMANNSKPQSNRKKSAKAAVGSPPPDDDEEPTSKTREEPTVLEARLWNLNKTDQLTMLTVVELRGLMKHIGKPTAGRKEELIGEVKKWLVQRQASANLHPVLDSIRPTRESSSDAESLEGTLLKAESNKSRQTEAMSRMTESYAAADLLETLVEKEPFGRDRQTMTEEKDFLANGNSITAPKSPQGASQRKKKPEKDSDEEDVQPAKVQVNEKKSRGSRKGGTKVEKQVEESVVEEVTVTTTKAGQKRKVQVSKSSQTKKGKVTEIEEEEVHAGPPWTMLVHKKPKPDWIVYNPDTMRPEPPSSGTKTMKLMSWNVNGLRALMKDKEKKTQEGLLLMNLAKEEDFDVLCLQETKLQDRDVEQIQKTLLSDYADSSWSCSTSKLGYSGTAVLSRVKPISVKSGMGISDHDSEGRLITVEFDTFFLVASYVPNSGEKLARLSYRTEEWDAALSRHIKELEKQKPVVLTGDLNCANDEIDIYNPDGNRKNAGFTKEERDSFKANFLNQGLVDTFRRQHPSAVGYTYWAYRSGARPKNQGWRLDYFLVSDALAEQVHDSYVRPDVLGSDHCPIGIILKL